MVQAFGPLDLGFAAVSLAISAGGVWFSIRIVHRVGIMDVPNERSSHSQPVPRTGGVPMVAAAALAFGGWEYLAVVEGNSQGGLLCTFLFGIAMSLLGFFDDLRNLSPLFRFLVQFISALSLLVFLALLPPEISLRKWGLPTWGWVFLGSFWVVWMLNLYNFMDGIDGLAGGEAAIAAFFFFLVFAYYGQSGWAVANLVLAAASMGFLVHNWPPAKVFMGDAGSAFLGAFFGMQSAVAALLTPIPFPVLVLPFANFLLDTTVTLILRIWRGEKWYKAHRTHFYQRMIKLRMSHRNVTVAELITAVLSCVAAICYLQFDLFGRAISIGVVVAGIIGGGFWISSRERTRTNTTI